MGVSANLLINARYGVKDVEKLLKALDVQVTETFYKGDHSFLYFQYQGQKRQMYVAHSEEYGGVNGLILSLGANSEATDLLTRIGKVVGGFFRAVDYNEDWEAFHDPHQGNARFILDHQILTTANSEGAKLAESVSEATGYER